MLYHLHGALSKKYGVLGGEYPHHAILPGALNKNHGMIGGEQP